MRICRVTAIPILLLAAVFFLSACGGGSGGGGSAPSPPTVTTALNNPSIDTAVISGNVNPNGLAATAWFEYGQDSSLSNPTRTDNQAVGFGHAPLSINATLIGLNAGTTYYYRVAASSSAGTAKGAIASLTSLSIPPTVITTTSGPDADNAVISGSANPNGFATTAWFEYAQDPDSSLSNPTRTDNQAIGSGKAPVSISATLTPLAIITKYWWRAAASNTAGTSKGEIKTFTTTSNPPPIANPGLPQSVFMGDSVTLDGSGSSDGGHGGTITYQWAQVAGTPVTLSGDTAANPTFTAPSNVPYPGEVLTFQLTVTSSRGTTATDDVTITVKWGLSDEFSTDTTGDYTFGIDNGIGTFTYDPSGQRALVTTGNDDVIHFSQVFSQSNSGVLSLDFSPIITFLTHGGIWVRLYQNPLSDNTYYEVSNFDWSAFGVIPFEPDFAAFKKIVGGVEVEKKTFPTSYLQGATYRIKITFGPANTTVEAFGQKVDLSGIGNPVGKFEIQIGQQDAYIDNILLEPKP
jgi:hypothetical protein